MTAIEAKQLMNQSQISLENILSGIRLMAKEGNSFYTIIHGNVSDDVIRSLKKLGYKVDYDKRYLNVNW